MDPFSRLGSRYSEFVSPHVVPRGILSSDPGAFVAPEARARVQAGGRGGVSSRYTPGPLPPSLSTALAAAVHPADGVAVLTRDMPASARTTNPTHEIPRTAKPVELSYCVPGLTDLERAIKLPLPQVTDMAFGFRAPEMWDKAGDIPVYSISQADIRARMLKRDVPLFPLPRLYQSDLVRSTDQPVRLVSPASVNYILALMERSVYTKMPNKAAYTQHLLNNPARSTFDRMFHFDGVVYDMGNSSESGYSPVDKKEGTKLFGMVTLGMATCYDYLRGVGNEEGADVMMLVTRRPVKADQVYTLGHTGHMANSGAASYAVQYTPNVKVDGEYGDTMWPIQISIFGVPTGGAAAPLLTAPWVAPPGCNHGAAAVKLGRVFFRNIGNVGEQPVLPVLQPVSGARHTLPPPQVLDDLQPIISTFDAAKRRPITLHFTGDKTGATC